MYADGASAGAASSMAYIDVDQWAGLAANVGVWQGEFIRLGRDRCEQSRTASRISLVAKGERHLEQHLDIGGQTQTLQITSLKKGLLFFPSGAFSQGSLQWSPFGEFGVELSLLAGQARRRLVALYRAEQQQSHLASITLIPEQSDSDNADDEQLPKQTLQPEPWGLNTAEVNPVQTMIQIDAFWQAEATSQPYTLASQPLPYQCTCALPLVLPKQQPFSLGLSWQVSAHERQHLERHYDVGGAWQAVRWYCEQI